MDINKVILGLALSLLLASGVAVADYESAYETYKSGDYKAAFKEMLPFAEEGHVTAQFMMGHMYLYGQGVPKNFKSAAKWRTLAAKQGSTSAQYGLGIMYSIGEGVLTDYKRAYMWLNLSDYNSDGASELYARMLKLDMEDIANKMTSADISKAQEMSSICLASNYTDC